jgi:hypothetical protein
MSALSKLARGQDCQVRLPGVCNFNPETTVLAHYRLAGTCGMGIKPPDLLGAWCCSSCHAVVDGQGESALERDERRLAFAEAVMRTLVKLIQLGKVKG